MVKKYVIGLAIIFFSAVMVFDVFKTGAQAEATAVAEETIQATDDYQTKVDAVRKAFAAERVKLDLSNTAGQLSTPESDLGEPDCSSAGGGSGGGGSSASAAPAGASQPSSCSACSKGAPVWVVNMVNLNFYMADTPLWHDSAVGPAVEMKLSYNSQSSQSGAFGNKWQLNYASYLYPVVDDIGLPAGIMVTMPDGKQDLYPPAGAGTFTPPYHVFNSLTEVAASHFELKFPDGRVFVYATVPGTASSVSLLVEMRDAYGQKLTLDHDATGRLTTITDALGKVTSLSYNSDGLVIQAADPFGRAAAFEYDANRNLTKITDMGGYWTSFTYRHYSLADYYLAGLTNAGGTWGFYFEPADGLDNGGAAYPAPGAAMGFNTRITVTDPFGGRQEYYRLGLAGPFGATAAWHVSPRDYVAYSGPDANNSESAVPKTEYTYVMTTTKRGEVGSITSPEGNTTTFGREDIDDAFNNTGNISSVSDGISGVSYTYNAMGKVTSITNALNINIFTALTYAANGVDLTGITNGLGTITLTYNGAHDITSYTDRSGRTKTITYNAYGKIDSVIDALGITTDYIYDSDHRLSEIRRSGETLESYTYDTIGRIKTDTDATGMTRAYEYNDLNDIEKITDPDGKFIGITYSSAFPHLVTAVTDRGGNTTQYAFNASKTLTEILDAEAGSTKFIRDVNGNLVQLIDPNEHTTGFAYDKDDRLVKKTFADGTATAYTYAGSERIASVTGSRNLSVYYSYDISNNLSGVSYTNDLAHYTYPVMMQYDAYRRRTAMIDAAGTTAYSYDADSRITSIDGPLASDTLTFQHDPKGRVTGYTLERGQSVSYTYDALDRLTEISAGAGVFSYAYFGVGPLVQKLTRPNGSTTEYQYDSMNRLTLVANKKSSGEIISLYEYAYNILGLRSSETVTNGAAVTVSLDAPTTYSYNSVNALLTSTNPARVFAYDADGNVTQWDGFDGKTFTAVYDIENRLTRAEYEIVSGGSYESYEGTYKYRGNGILAEKKMAYFNSTSGENFNKTVKYVGNGLLTLQERDKSDNILREYTWGPNSGGGIGGLLSLNQGGQDYFYLYDGKGNVTAVIDSAQNVAAAYAYDPFGNVLTKTGTLDQPYQFSTKPYDEKTGLSYFGYRFYAPAIGRWMARDPLGESAGINLYEFVKSDPVNRVDPSGLDSCGPGEVRLETRIDNDDDTFSTGYICAPEKNLWQKINDWLESFVQPEPLGPDRAAYQCRRTAGFSPPPTRYVPGL